MMRKNSLRMLTAVVCLLLCLLPLAEAAYGTLRRGSSGDLVLLMQIKMNELGYGLVEDGKYGAKTAARVREFQIINGLRVDGVAGEETLSKLYSGNAKRHELITQVGGEIGSGTTAKVATKNNRTLYLRSSMSASGKDNVIGLMPMGATVEVIGRYGGWTRIRYQGRVGYTMTSYLSIAEDEQPPVAPGDPTKAIVNTLPGRVLNLRNSANAISDSNIIGYIPSGRVITLHEKGTNWCRVSYNGMTGYVMTGYLKFP